MRKWLVANGVTVVGLVFMVALSLQAFKLFPVPFTLSPHAWKETMEHQYSLHAIHKATAGALLEGSLSYPYQPTIGYDYDLQLYNGAVYTNWGYGIPLLQLPFHAFQRLLYGNDPLQYFPDRIIFALFLSIITILFYFALRRLLSNRLQPEKAWKLDILTILLETTFLAVGLFWLITSRFIIYEETISYLILSQLAVIACYIFYAIDKKKTRWAYIAGICLGLGVLIRPTGLFYLVLLPFIFFLTHKDWKVFLRISVGAVPLGIFWMYTNVVRTGKLLSTGFENVTPSLSDSLGVLRFGSTCNDSISGMWLVAKEMFYALFIGSRPSSQQLQDCFFSITEYGVNGGAFLGISVLVLLIAILLFYVLKERRRVEMLLPLTGIVIIFALYVYAGHGFGYRYSGDFWPFILLAIVQLLLFSKDHISKKAVAGAIMVLPLVFLPLFSGPIHSQKKDILTTVNPVQRINYNKTGGAVVFDAWHILTGPSIPAHRRCTDLPYSQLPYDRSGWLTNCSISRVSNFLMGVPEKHGSDYALLLRIDKKHTDTIRVFINGNTYVGEWENDAYVVRFQLDYNKLTNPIVLVSVEWNEPPLLPNRYLIEAIIE